MAKKKSERIRVRYEVVKTVEFSEVVSAHGEDTLRFRLEVLRDVEKSGFRARLYLLDFFRLRPTFPLEKGRNAFTDVEIWSLEGLSEETYKSADEAVSHTLAKMNTQIYGR